MRIEVEDETQRWIDASEDRRWSFLLDYWRDLIDRLGRLPHRGEIDPLSLPKLWPNLFLVDVVREDGKAPRFRFRLLGGAIVTRESVRPGQFLDDFPGMRDSERIMRHYHNTLDLKVSIRSATLAWDHPTKEFITYHALLLPLSDAPLSDQGQAVDTILGLAIYEA